MAKHTVSPSWFSKLKNPNSHLKWLSLLASSVDTIANFGCNSSEFLALLWYLDAVEINVVEKEEENLSKPMGPRDQLDSVGEAVPAALEGRSVRFIVEDMSNLKEDQLSSDYCDLAYCEEVLYFMMPDLEKVQKSINQMARVVRSGGWVIAVETKIGAEVQEVENQLRSRLSGQRIVQHVPVSDPIDISSLFEAAGLVKVSLDGAPEWLYCYKKPNRPPKPRWS